MTNGKFATTAGHIVFAGGQSPQTVEVTPPDGLPPGGYHVCLTPSMKAVCWVSAKSETSFTVHLDNGGTIPAGFVDVTIFPASAEGPAR